MLVNERIRAVRLFRRLEGKELAQLAGISAGEISHLEKNKRTPRVETLQRIAAALDVTASFLMGEEGDDLPLGLALGRESLKLFLRQSKPNERDLTYLNRVLSEGSAPNSVRGWADLLLNVRLAAH